ncbi:VanZ family protein [Haloprofundus salinisoli]|uniref:VanZ family protein n=1 Tax=Haloprofundus salinisoli TaxID=2876193 RepID=UPI001CCD60FC|nr:VanZ family protein [Haloprofundus salinisoli]
MAPAPSHTAARPSLLPPRLRWAAVVVVAGGVFVASVVTPPSDGVPALGPFGLVGADKWLHAAAYAVVAGTLSHALSTRVQRASLGGFVGGSVYGLGIELVQGLVPARQFDLLDAVANGVGAALGAGLWVVFAFGLALVVGRESDSSRP